MQTVAIEQGERRTLVSHDDLAERIDREIDQLERLRRWSRTGAIDAPSSGRGAPLLPQEIQRELRFLRQLAAGMACADPGPVWFDRAGFGSVLLVRDLDRMRDHFHRLVTQRLDPLDLSQVSVASELGRALTGRVPGNEIEVEDGGRVRRLRIVTLTTLPTRLRMRAG